jgi:hypothetical protein
VSLMGADGKEVKVVLKEYAEWPPKSLPFVTSSVIGPGQWYDETLLVPHEAIRYCHLDFERACRLAKPEVSWHASNLLGWFDGLYAHFIHTHHDTEEKIFFPEYQRKKIAVPPKLTDDHKTLIQRLDAVAAVRVEFDKAKDDVKARAEAHALLTQRVVDLRVHMFEHLAEEENVFPVLTQRHFRQSEHDALVETILKSFSLQQMSVELVLIVQAMRKWGGEPVLKRFLAPIPGFFAGTHTHTHTRSRGALCLRMGGFRKLIRSVPLRSLLPLPFQANFPIGRSITTRHGACC